MRKTAVVLVTLLFSLAVGLALMGQDSDVGDISVSIGDQLLQSGKKTVAVVDFVDLQGNVTELGRYLSEEVSDALASSGKGIEVVERTQLHTLMQEYKLDSTGLVDPSTAQRLGKISGASAIITGTITPLGDTVRVTVKILDTQTARIIGAARTSIPRTRAIDELLSANIGAATQTKPARPPAGATAAGPKNFAPSSYPEAHAEGFRFQVVGSHAEGSRLTCTLLVTNEGQSGRTLVIGKVIKQATVASNSDQVLTRVIDDRGNVYLPSAADLGSAHIGNTYNRSVSADLPPGVPIKLVLGFDGLSADVSQLGLLQLGCGFPGTVWGFQSEVFAVELHGIPVGR